MSFDLRAILETWLPTLIALVMTGLVLFVADRVLFWGRRRQQAEGRLLRQIAMLVLTAIGVVVLILNLPIDGHRQGQLISLLGLLLSGALALASTTFLGNFMAGIMLRALGNIRPGDFIEVGQEFGRVSERGAFHVEIQRPDRGLTTLPNLVLATGPVRVTHSSGTIVSSRVSLGYDVPRSEVTGRLEEAARQAGLEEPFVRILSLGDFSVLYEVSGLLEDVKTLLSARSRLNGEVLDALHAAGIEIVSPNFMNQRVLDSDRRFIPARAAVAPARAAESEAERIVFDKADAAAVREQLMATVEKLAAWKANLKRQRGQAESDEARARIEQQLERVGRQIERMQTELEEEQAEK